MIRLTPLVASLAILACPSACIATTLFSPVADATAGAVESESGEGQDFFSVGVENAATGELSHSEGGASGSAWASVEAGRRLRAFAKASSNPDSSAVILAGASAQFLDRVFALRDNIIQTTGKLSLVYSFRGSVSIVGGASAGASWEMMFGGEPVADSKQDAGEIKEGGILQPTIVNASAGIPLQWAVGAGAENAFGAGSTATANLGSTGEIVRIEYLDENGVLDPDVIVVGSSGINYSIPVPEPASIWLAAGGLATTVLLSLNKRRRAVDAS